MLTIYAPSNKNSKAWEVFNGVKEAWPDQVEILSNAVEKDPKPNSMFWGFVGNNLEMVHKLEARKHNYWFTDTPYFGRFDNNNLRPDNHYWRICKNGIHAKFIPDCKSDRFDKFGIKINAPRLSGGHILVCPSSAGINNYLQHSTWTKDIVDILERHTNRPIRLRHKPRGRGTSGPSEATVPLAEDLKDAWAIVTSCSIAAVEAVCMGVPVFCHPKSFAASIGNLHLEDIESPYYGDPEPWLYSLAYQQFTPEEIGNGTAVGTLLERGLI